MTLREDCENAAREVLGETCAGVRCGAHDSSDGQIVCDDCGGTGFDEHGRAVIDAMERVANKHLERNLTTCPICSCVRCDALRKKHRVGLT